MTTSFTFSRGLRKINFRAPYLAMAPTTEYTFYEKDICIRLAQFGNPTDSYANPLVFHRQISIFQTINSEYLHKDTFLRLVKTQNFFNNAIKLTFGFQKSHPVGSLGKCLFQVFKSLRDFHIQLFRSLNGMVGIYYQATEQQYTSWKPHCPCSNVLDSLFTDETSFLNRFQQKRVFNRKSRFPDVVLDIVNHCSQLPEKLLFS